MVTAAEVALEDEIATVRDLIDGVEPAQIHRAPFPLGELRSQQQRPVVQALADYLAGEPIGGPLQGGDIVDGQERVVVLAEADFVPVQFLFDEAVAVEIVGGLEWEERRHAHRHRSQCFVPQVEIVVREAAPLRSQNAVVGILGGKLGHGTAEGRPLFHALENEIDAVLAGPLHAAQPGPDVIFFTDTLLGPLHGDLVVAGERLDPSPIFAGPFAQHRLVHHRNPDHVAEKVDHLFGARQPAQIPMDDDAVETVVYKNQQAGKQLGEQFHRSSGLRSCLDNSIFGQTTGGIKISNMFA